MPGLIVDKIGKQYSRSHADRPVTFQEAALAGWRHMKAAEKFWALKDVSFALDLGQTLGIIGKNGSGKSTLVRLIGGVVNADEGTITSHGRVCALLDPDGCFHRDLTGRENAHIGAVVSGLSRAQASARIESIIDFAELNQFMENPVRSYSSGMKMRLAFAIAVHADPQILIIDEALAVSDYAFQAKCFQEIARLKEAGCIVALVSHSMDQIRQYSDQVLFLSKGRIAACGDPHSVVYQYENDQSLSDDETICKPLQTLLPSQLPVDPGSPMVAGSPAPGEQVVK